MSEYVKGGRFTPASHKSMIANVAETVLYTPHWSAKHGTLWLVPDIQNASHIWCSGGPGSRGLGGHEKTFPLVKAIGGSITLKGPFHANPHDLFNETGIDMRNQIWSWGVLGRRFDHDANSGRDVIADLVYIDTIAMPGVIDRVERLGQTLIDLGYEEELFYYSETAGGCGYGKVNL